MPAHRRKFIFDKTLGKVVEITPDDQKPLLAELAADAERFRKELEFGLPSSNTRRNSIASWPIHSEAIAVDPEDIPTAQAELARHGVKTDFDRLGRPILRDRAHRKAHCEALGFYDRNAGYGDPQPKNFTGTNQRADYRII